MRLWVWALAFIEQVSFVIGTVILFELVSFVIGTVIFCFIVAVSYLEQFLIELVVLFIVVVSFWFLSKLYWWVGRLPWGPSPTNLYMHICIWMDEISTSLGWNINQLIFLKNEIVTSKKTNLSTRLFDNISFIWQP